MKWREYLRTTYDILTVGVLVVAVTVLAYNYLGPSGARRDRVFAPKADSTLDLKGIPVVGDSSATLVLVEFSDFQCPFCKRHAKTVFPELKKEFVATGKLKYAFANNPLSSIHPLARFLASSGICADRQKHFWEMHERLYDSKIESEEDVAVFARDLGMNLDEFMNCLQDEEATGASIDRETETARSLGLESTPSFALGKVDSGGQVVVMKLIRGSQPIEVFRDTINEVSRAIGQ